MKPCIDCGVPTAGTRCTDCTEPPRQHSTKTADRGYGANWQRLSRRARRLQPFCTDCGADEDLTTDHLPSAWERLAAGKSIRLGIDAEVVCRSCNSKRGAARGGGGNPRRGDPDRRGEAGFPSHTAEVAR